MGKITKEKFKTYKTVFDDWTERNIAKLMAQGHFNEILSPIALGKEANVFTAEKKDGTIVIIKIYRLETCDFNRMYDYLRLDVRYSSVKHSRRSIIFTWAQREYRNLMKAREKGIRVPTPMAIRDNILILEYIGDDVPAPKLKDYVPKARRKVLDKIIEYMKKLHQLGLVHGDLSEFNILIKDDNPYFIDFSQSSSIESSTAKELLERDCKNIARFFTKIGTEIEMETIWKKITGKEHV